MRRLHCYTKINNLLSEVFWKFVVEKKKLLTHTWMYKVFCKCAPLTGKYSKAKKNFITAR